LIQNDLKLTGRMVGHQFFLEGWNGQKSIWASWSRGFQWRLSRLLWRMALILAMHRSLRYFSSCGPGLSTKKGLL